MLDEEGIKRMEMRGWRRIAYFEASLEVPPAVMGSSTPLLPGLYTLY